MTHHKYQRIRIAALMLSTVIFVSAVVFGILSLLNAENSADALKKAVPIIFAVGLAAFILFLLFGRIFCGFFCPLGFLQDVTWKLTEKMHLPRIPRNEKFMKVMNILNRIFLIFFICGMLSITVILAFFPEILAGIRIPLFVPFVALFFMIFLNSFARRLFCNVCPIGSFIGLFEKCNVIHLKKDCGACTACGACYEACPMRIKEVYTETEKSDVSNPRCIYCGECVKKCQKDQALTITAFGKKICRSSEEDFITEQFSDITVKSKDEK